MKYKILPFIFLHLFFVKSNAQQLITPSVLTEVCPIAPYQFSVVIDQVYAGTTPNVVSYSGNPTVTMNSYNITSGSGITSFYFNGSFDDKNVSQTFRINYKNSSNNSTYKDFTFSKIKSLYYQTSCNTIQPNITSINQQQCDVSAININFSNIQYGTFLSSPANCFGTISNYDYLIPSGWILGSTTSNGSTWISGNNNVNITPNDKGGDGQKIKIRPINSCAAIYNNVVFEIPITRPKPVLNFTSNPFICSNSTFQVSNVPSWVTNYSWSVTPSNVFSISNPTTSTPTISKVSNGEGNVQLEISKTGCSVIYNTSEIIGNQVLVAGPPQVLNINPNLMIYYSPGDENDICTYQGNTYDFTYTSNSNINWTAVSHVGGPWPSWNADGNGDLYVEFFNPRQNKMVLNMNASNTCGSTAYNFGFKAVTCTLNKHNHSKKSK